MRHRLHRFAACGLAALALASCGAPEEDPSQDPAAGNADMGSDAPVPTPAGLELEPLGTELATDIGPTLGGCSFEHDGDTLLFAGATDDIESGGRGVIQVGGSEMLLDGEGSGGPEYINAGPTLSGGDYTVIVDRGEGEGEVVGIESTQWPADLVVRDGAGAEQSYSPGTWTCGV